MSKFDNLKNKLAQDPKVRNPAALAASIDKKTSKKQYGATPFAKVVAKGHHKLGCEK